MKKDIYMPGGRNGGDDSQQRGGGRGSEKKEFQTLVEKNMKEKMLELGQKQLPSESPYRGVNIHAKKVARKKRDVIGRHNSSNPNKGGTHSSLTPTHIKGGVSSSSFQGTP